MVSCKNTYTYFFILIYILLYTVHPLFATPLYLYFFIQYLPLLLIYVFATYHFGRFYMSSYFKSYLDSSMKLQK